MLKKTVYIFVIIILLLFVQCSRFNHGTNKQPIIINQNKMQEVIELAREHIIKNIELSTNDINIIRLGPYSYSMTSYDMLFSKTSFINTLYVYSSGIPISFTWNLPKKMICIDGTITLSTSTFNNIYFISR